MSLKYLFEERVHVKDANLDLDDSAVAKIKKAVDDMDGELADKIVDVLMTKFGLDETQVFSVFKEVVPSFTEEDLVELLSSAEPDEGDEEENAEGEETGA